jgi:hypothetical protein
MFQWMMTVHGFGLVFVHILILCSHKLLLRFDRVGIGELNTIVVQSVARQGAVKVSVHVWVAVIGMEAALCSQTAVLRLCNSITVITDIMLLMSLLSSFLVQQNLHVYG